MTPAKNGNGRALLFELAWILPSIAIPVGMLSALMVTTFVAGLHLPGVAGRVSPAKVSLTAPFNHPGIVQVGPEEYEATVVAQIWAFTPNVIRVPQGSTVTFIATSRDVVHGFMVHDADVNVMLLPGQVSRVTTRFDRVGEFPFVCHEYCGVGHQTMWGKVIVEPRAGGRG